MYYIETVYNKQTGGRQIEVTIGIWDGKTVTTYKITPMIIIIIITITITILLKKTLLQQHTKQKKKNHLCSKTVSNVNVFRNVIEMGRKWNQIISTNHQAKNL